MCTVFHSEQDSEQESSRIFLWLLRGNGVQRADEDARAREEATSAIQVGGDGVLN